MGQLPAADATSSASSAACSAAAADRQGTSSAASRPAKRRKAVPTVALYVRIPATLQRNLKLMAVAEDTTISQLVADMLRAHVGIWVEPYKRAS